MPDRPDETDEAGRVLDRVRRDAEVLGTSSLARMSRRVGDHFAGADAVGDAEGGAADPVEVWARRVGRALSLCLGAVLVWWLGAQLGWW